MEVKKKKYVFIILSALLLAYMFILCRSAGVNCDELLHYNQSVAVYNYFASHGKDTSALDTPVTHLKYYGQSYDNITTILIKTLGIDDIYGFRHIMSTIAGWLTIIIAAMFAIWLAGYEAGIIVLVLFAVSPTFLGHAQNNLKDIPFALGYISSTYFIFRLITSERKTSYTDIFLVTVSIAFCISIRPGGLVLIFFLYAFLIAYYLFRLLRDGRAVLPVLTGKVLTVTGISIAAWLFSTLLWPYAIQHPIRNILESYKVMVHFPDTFRQIFEGRAEWSDYMPWYYLPKSMAITIPFIVLAGFLMSLFIIIPRKGEKQILYLFLLSSILLPVIFVIISRSNLYSSWRHFLFVYPAIVILASVTFPEIFKTISGKFGKITFILAFIALLIHPFLFIAENPRYPYLYYNQSVGGLKGAYGNYETDYYFINQRESSEWLIGYLDKNNIKGPVTVGSNFSAEWFFRNRPMVRNIYFRNEERSMNDWDYYIVTNRYISPYQLKGKIWPPRDALKIIYADGVPIAAILKRNTKSDLMGYMALTEKRNNEAVSFFEQALNTDSCDEVIFYNFAVALNRTGDYQKADSALERCLKLNPDFELALMYLGNIEAARGNRERAMDYYRRLIRVNRKYNEAYEALANIKNQK